jgi:shikimate kinase
MIENCFGASIAAMVEELGWETFRMREEWILTGDLRRNRVIFDLGGGVVLNSALMDRVSRSALVVFLDCPAETLIERADAGYARPALTDLEPDEEIRQTLAARLPLYRRYAEVTVDTSLLSPRESAEWIARVVDSLEKEAS